ncbi:P-loop containing nucleoside triphosphate hydrolase protein, partial [Tuber brumale]
DKYRVLVELYPVLTIGPSIIFVKKHETAFEVRTRLDTDGHKVATLHGANEGLDSDKAIDAFRSGKAKVLFAADVLARGIDWVTVSMALHIDLPRDLTGRPDDITYLHNIAPTRRSGRFGLSISFAHGNQSKYGMTQL